MRRGAAAACVLAALPGVGGRFLGFHLDDERCTGPDSRFGNRSALVPPCLAVLQEYAFFVGNLSGTGLTLAVDSGACVAPTCYNVTWNGVSKRGHEHVRPLAPVPTPHPPPLPLPAGIHASGAPVRQVIDIVNETVVMDYIDTPAGAVSYQGRGAAWLLSYAATFSPPRPVRLGLAVRQPGAPNTWWQADNISALDALLNGVVPLAAAFPSWNGLAVFHTALWRASVRPDISHVQFSPTLTHSERDRVGVRAGAGRTAVAHRQPRAKGRQGRAGRLVRAAGRNLQRHRGASGVPQVGGGDEHHDALRAGLCRRPAQRRP